MVGALDSRGDVGAMGQVVLVRHAAATGQDPSAPLSADGYRQAGELADFLRGFDIDRVVSSPFRRAVESAEPFANHRGLAIETDARLVERVLSARSLPDWRDHLRRSFEEPDYCLLAGESSRVAQARTTAAVLEASAGGMRSLVVTHGNLVALILKSVDSEVGYEAWAQLSNPDVFAIHTDALGQRRFRRVWPEARCGARR
jgi:2,3-bisphosphoglycerate-dependent phosphoglycerate mutase